MKFSKVVNNQVLTKPISLDGVLKQLNLSLSKGMTNEAVLARLRDLNWFPVMPGGRPVIPAELLGRCKVSLGFPARSTDGVLTRTYEYAAASDEEVAYQTKYVRAKRDKILQRYVDSVNAIRWSAMTAEEQAKWTAYRQALLDIPGQAGFPMNVVWPNLV